MEYEVGRGVRGDSREGDMSLCLRWVGRVRPNVRVVDSTGSHGRLLDNKGEDQWIQAKTRTRTKTRNEDKGRGTRGERAYLTEMGKLENTRWDSPVYIGRRVA